MASRRPGAGRPPNWLRDECRSIIRKHKLLEFLTDVAVGEPVQKMKGVNGEVTNIKVSAEIKDRLKAVEMIKDWGFGKATQNISAQDEEGNTIPCVVMLAPQQMGTAGGVK